MRKMRHDRRARDDVARSVALSDERRRARCEGAGRRAAIADNGKLLMLKFGATCVVCGAHIDAGAEALWFASGEVAHVRWQCPARPEYRAEPVVIQMGRAGRGAMWESAGWKPKKVKSVASAPRL